MAVCSECSLELDPGWKYCIRCGAPVPVRATAHANANAAARPATVNPVAVLALVLGGLASPLAAVFGPVALSQVRRTGERGRLPALIATVLGIGWTVLGAVILVVLLRGAGT